jgi:epoxide hydrolase-like predicted phosphatase
VPVRAVLFDIGGVLEDTPPTGWMDRWATRLGYAPGAFERRVDTLLDGGELGTVTEAQVRARLADGLSLDPAAATAFWDDLWAEYLGSANHAMLDFVASLRPDYRVGLLSNSFVGAREREESAHGLSRLVDEILYSHEHGLKKPDAAFYRLACDRLGVRPAEVLFVDDHAVCVTAARGLGMHAVHFTTEDDTIRAMRAVLDGT